MLEETITRDIELFYENVSEYEVVKLYEIDDNTWFEN